MLDAEMIEEELTSEDLARTIEQSHPSVKAVMQYFTYDHLPSHLQDVSRACATIANFMAILLPDSPEKTAGLRKLLEAKDCFVRAAIRRD